MIIPYIDGGYVDSDHEADFKKLYEETMDDNIYL